MTVVGTISAFVDVCKKQTEWAQDNLNSKSGGLSIGSSWAQVRQPAPLGKAHVYSASSEDRNAAFSKALVYSASSEDRNVNVGPVDGIWLCFLDIQIVEPHLH